MVAMVDVTMLPALHVAAREATSPLALNRKGRRFTSHCRGFVASTSLALRCGDSSIFLAWAQSTGVTSSRIAPKTNILEHRERIGADDNDGLGTVWDAWLYGAVDPRAADVATLVQMPGVTRGIVIALMAARPYPDAGVFREALAVIRAPTDELAFAVAAQFLVSDRSPREDTRVAVAEPARCKTPRVPTTRGVLHQIEDGASGR